MSLEKWILRPFVRLIHKSGHDTIPQSVGLLTGFAFDKEFESPVLFAVADTIVGNVNVKYINGTTEIIDCQFLSQRNMLIVKIFSASTTVALGDIRLEI